ncbi:MAG: glycosyltransferase family 4 protein [Ignavibacteria bacterium]|nr:glycosyltransferase family 4 protein [Ignavibacteria bacterium]
MESVKDKIKICVVTAILPPAYGGAEVAAFKYVMRLKKDPDSEVIVIGWDRTGSYKRSNLNYDFVHSVQFSENPKDAKGILIYFQQMYHMWNCFRVLVIPMWKYRDKYDYIHNFNSGFAFNRVSIFIAKVLGKKVITETSLIGDDDPLSLGRFPNWKDYMKPKYLRYVFYKMADRYVSKSEVITEIFKKSEIPMNKVVQIPYSVDMEKYKPIGMEKKMELREKLKVWKEGKIILFVGGINIRKGVEVLVDAYIQIEKKFPDLKLLIVGPTYKYDQKYISTIKNKIKENNLNEKVYMTEDNVENVEEYMQSSDIFVLPSRQEGFPISVIEAMSCGLAVVGSDIPEIAKAQISSGKDGYTFKEGSSKELAVTLEKLLTDIECISRIGIEARKKVENNWSTEIVDKAYRNLYMSI